MPPLPDELPRFVAGQRVQEQGAERIDIRALIERLRSCFHLRCGIGEVRQRDDQVLNSHLLPLADLLEVGAPQDPQAIVVCGIHQDVLGSKLIDQDVPPVQVLQEIAQLETDSQGPPLFQRALASDQLIERRAVVRLGDQHRLRLAVTLRLAEREAVLQVLRLKQVYGFREHVVRDGEHLRLVQ